MGHHVSGDLQAALLFDKRCGSRRTYHFTIETDM
jgi:hypothetical protein